MLYWILAAAGILILVPVFGLLRLLYLSIPYDQWVQLEKRRNTHHK